MKSAACVGASTNRKRAVIWSLLLAATLVMAAISGASAQLPSGVQGAPIEVGGWRYIRGPNDLHVYLCDQPGCAPNAKVSFLFYPGLTIAPGQFHRQRELVGELLQERPSPCTLVGEFSLGGAQRPTHCVATAPDGAKSYDTVGIVTGSHSSVSLISSSRDEAVSDANYGRFEPVLRTFINSDLRTNP